MKAIIIKDENLHEVLATFPADFIYQISNPLPPTSARVMTIPTDNVRAAAGVIADDMAKRHITEYIYFDQALKPYVDMSRRIILINHNQGINYSVFFDNFFANLPYILKSPGVRKDQFKGVPALIVSSGPSLNKNIHLFGEAKKKCLTITSGSAIEPLQKRRFNPDAACAIDPWQANTTQFKQGNYRMLVNHTADPRCVSQKECSFFYAGDSFDIPLTLPPTKKVQVDISVATVAYNLAVLWGCDPIIFIGQDCGVSEGEKYAEGVSVREYDDKYEATYNMLADYFRIVFERHNGTIYNCTEGGRHLGEGAKHLPLAEVLSSLPKRPKIAWEDGKPWDVSFEAKQQAKDVWDSYRLAKMFDAKANTADKVERFLRQQQGTTAWKWLGKMITPIMYECEGDFRKWYLAYLKWQEWCKKLAERLESV